MAAPTRSSTGMMVALSIFALLTLGLFITTIVFVAKVQRLSDELAQARTDLSEAVSPGERDRFAELQAQAGNQSVVGYLDSALQEAMRRVTGSRRDTLESFNQKLATRLGEGTSTSLLAAYDEQSRRIDTLESELERERASREEIEQELIATNERVEALQKAYDEAIARNENEVSAYTGRVEDYRADLEQTVDDVQERVTSIRTESDAIIESLETEVANLESQILVLEDQLRRLRGEQRDEILTPLSEDVHVDGTIIGVNPVQNQVTIDRGRDDNMVLGLTFEAYDTGTAVRPNEEGEYPPGKASLEVIRVEQGTSVARIIRQVQGNPIVRGDVVVNPVYDPNKEYVFVVFGNFDANADGTKTAQEQLDIRAMIREWGGEVRDDIDGETDFVVLGSKPILPPQPQPDDPPELTLRYLRLKQAVRKYDELFETASQTGIPVLNENRLYTLTGMHAQRR